MGTITPLPGPRAPGPVQTARYLRSPPRFLERCHAAYGDTFEMKVFPIERIAVLADPAAVKDLLSADRGMRSPKSRAAFLEPILGPRSVLVIDGVDHLSRRRMMLGPFHGERMLAYEEIIVAETLRELDRWPVDEPFPLQPRMAAITLEVILRAVFGVTDEARRARLRSYLTLLLGIVSAGSAQVRVVVSRRLGGLGMPRALPKVLQKIDAEIAAEVAERRADPELSERTDILSMLAEARDPEGEALSDRELRDQLMTLLVAGHETTATSLAWAFDRLFRTPAAMERLSDELDGGDGEAYLDAVVSETLRARPVIPAVGRVLHESRHIGGRVYPAGQSMLAAIWLVHKRPDLYPEPEAFRPERFLEDPPETYGWIPFGGGVRRCLGAAFATFEMKVVLREVLGRARLRAATDDDEPVTARNITLAPGNGTPALLTEPVRETVLA